MKKIKFLSLLLGVLIAFNSIGATALAETVYDYYGSTRVETEYVKKQVIQPLALVPAMDYVKNKVLTGTTRKINEYLTSDWAPADKYTVNAGESTTASLSVSGTADFSKRIKATGTFLLSKTYTRTVTTSIPADPSRMSKLTYQVDFNKYTCDLYYRPAYNPIGTIPPMEYVSSGTVEEPSSNSYIIVKYQ